MRFLSGSLPPVESFNPVIFVLLAALYGRSLMVLTAYKLPIEKAENKKKGEA